MDLERSEQCHLKRHHNSIVLIRKQENYKLQLLPLLLLAFTRRYLLIPLVLHKLLHNTNKEIITRSKAQQFAIILPVKGSTLVQMYCFKCEVSLVTPITISDRIVMPCQAVARLSHCSLRDVYSFVPDI